MNEEHFEASEVNEEKPQTQERWKSWALWMAVLSTLGLFLKAAGVWDRMGLGQDEWDGATTAILSVLAMFGVINNPTSKHTI